VDYTCGPEAEHLPNKEEQDGFSQNLLQQGRDELPVGTSKGILILKL
jgi:hypothetical protein